MSRVTIRPRLLKWARDRANLTIAELTKKFPKFEAWELGVVQPTFRQIEAFAKATLVPIGYLFLPDSPEEPLPIPDFRTVSGVEVVRPSPNLLDTIYTMQRRQAWLRDERIECEA